VASALGLGLCAVLATAGCSPPGSPLLIGRAPGGPANAAPTVRWAGRAIATTGLPAIARDGRSIVIAHRDGDAGRGNPNMTLVEKDRGDRELDRRVVITSDDVDRLDPHELELRFTAAARWLDERAAARQLVAMAALVTTAPTDDAPAQATGAGLTVRWTPNQLIIERVGGTAVVRATPTSWLAADYPLCQTCSEVCHNEAFLAGGYADVERSAAVVVVAYRGTDTCWEPGSQEHIVVW